MNAIAILRRNSYLKRLYNFSHKPSFENTWLALLTVIYISIYSMVILWLNFELFLRRVFHFPKTPRIRWHFDPLTKSVYAYTQEGSLGYKKSTASSPVNSHSAYRTAHSGSTNDSIGRVNVNGESVLPGSYQLQIRQELLLPIQLLIEKLIGFPAEAVNLAKMINGFDPLLHPGVRPFDIVELYEGDTIQGKALVSTEGYVR